MTAEGPRTLTESIRFFTGEQQYLSCMSAACGTADRVCTAEGGTVDLRGTPVTPDTVFDLASLTKCFSAVLLLRLWEAGLLDRSAPVTRYAPQFRRLGGVTVDQLMGFELAVTTPARVDAQASPEAAKAVLFEAVPAPNGVRAYSDIHSMVLKYVAEGAGGQPWMDLLRQQLLRPLGMAETWCLVPQDVRQRCVSYDREHRLERGVYTLREGIAPGTAHDPKARAVNPDGDDCPGHAGLFSTRGDLVKLCQGLLSGKLLSDDALAEMSRNRTGHPLPGGGHTQYLGCQCYVKHPEQYHSEIPAYMGLRAFGWSGFTGNHLAVDPERGLFEFYLGNRVLDRCTTLLPEAGKTVCDYGLAEDGSGLLPWPDGRLVRSSVLYVHQKDAHWHPAVVRTLGL